MQSQFLTSESSRFGLNHPRSAVGPLKLYDAGKLLFVERRDRVTFVHTSGSDHEIMCTDQIPLLLESRPEPGVDAGAVQAKRDGG